MAGTSEPWHLSSWVPSGGFGRAPPGCSDDGAVGGPVSEPTPVGLSARNPEWHASAWSRVVEMLSRDRLPHALLLHGPLGVGKGLLARRLVAAVLCEVAVSARAAGEGCGECRSCRLLSAGTHPDASWMLPEDPRGSIGIDEVRGVVARVGLTSHYGGSKSVVVEPAEAMTTPAANALLKTLEEPPGDAVFILVSHAPARIAPTIRSRCQALAIGLPGPDAARAWLEHEDPLASALLPLADGAPLEALRLSRAGEGEQLEAVRSTLLGVLAGREGVVEAAELLAGLRIPEAILRTVVRLVNDLIRLKFGLRVPLSPEQADSLAEVADLLEFSRLYWIMDRAYETERTLNVGIRLSEQLVVEDLVVALSEIARGPRESARA